MRLNIRKAINELKSMNDNYINNSAPIGVFDSGLGGLTVLKEMLSILPNENTIYFGDSGRAPYGTKSPDTIRHFAAQDASFLRSKGVKAIVIACNTAGSYAYSALRDKFDIPVIEVISPGARAAVKATRNGRIGVIGTSATISSGIYEKYIYEQASSESQIQVFSRPCPLFVGLAEEGWWDDEITRLVAEKYLTQLKNSNVDTIVLGCTHYPLLRNPISAAMGKDVVLINSAAEVVREVSKVLSELDLLNKDDPCAARYHKYYTSDSEEKFKGLGSTLLDVDIDTAVKVDIEKFSTDFG